MKKLAIVLLNWNGKTFLERFIPNIKDHSSYQGVELVVIDNASADDSVDYMKTNHPDVRLVLLDKNYGFAGGYNQGLDQIEASYYLLLNTDVEVTEGWLDPLLAWMDKHPDTGVCMPKINAWDDRGSFEYAGAAGGYIDFLGYSFCRGRIFDFIEKDHGQYDDPVSVFWATGACMLIRSELFYQLGGFDPDFFAHMEEIDLCWRVKNFGYNIFCVPQSRVYHIGGGTLPKNNPRKTYLNFRNNLYLLYKNLPDQLLIKTFLTRIVLDWISSFHLLLQGKSGDAKAVLQAHIDFIKQYNQLRAKRKAIRSYSRLPRHKEIYQKSVVWKFFVQNNKKYSDLEF